jgi:hypothetical protein
MAEIECDLYRAIHKDSPEAEKLTRLAAGRSGATADGLLHARVQGDVQTGSDQRQFIEGADVTLERSGEDEPWHVLADGGTSMHDVPGWFGYSRWSYFSVPEGTEYCADTLCIKRDKKKKWNRTRDVSGRHYTIRPKTRMTLDAYFGALDNLARAAVARSVELGRSVKVIHT